MKVHWQNVASSFLDQLAPWDRERITQAVIEASKEWDRLSPLLLRPMPTPERLKSEQVYVLRVGREYRIFLRREQDRVVVLDIARRSQLEALKPRLLRGAGSL
jgi:mRNA-degrading endonuclease RelE of RelBE toxin-antitoxin system